MYSTILSGGLCGMESYITRVEVDCSRGLPGFDMVGLLGSEIKEARERIRVAFKNMVFQLPPMRITVNISPASLHKDGTFYDLPVAAGILTAQGIIPQEYVNDVMIAGELGLNGEIHAVRGILPMVLEAKKRGISKCVVPAGNLEETALIAGIRIAGIGKLEELPELLCNKDYWESEGIMQGTFRERDNSRQEASADFSQVRGQEGKKRAAMVAAAGFHHMLMIGPPGAGKTMIARCIPSILPPLSEKEILEVASVYSVAGQDVKWNQIMKRPFVDPHHTITKSALTGGGREPGPGAVSLAHKGVLFLDELSEFQRTTLDLLRQPLEEHFINLARSSGTYRFPADFMLVAAMNPCPCGFYPDRGRCRCTPHEVKRYLNRVSGPVLDRIDICTEVEKVDFKGLIKNEDAGKTAGSDEMRSMVQEARERQNHRYRDCGVSFNSQLDAGGIRTYCTLGMREEAYLEQLFDLLQLSARSCHRLLRVARTLADLDRSEQIQMQHLSEAACYRAADGKYWGRE